MGLFFRKKNDEAELKIKTSSEGLDKVEKGFSKTGKAVEDASKKIGYFEGGLDKLVKKNKVLSDSMLAPFIVLATGGSMAQAALAGVQSVIESTVLGPIGYVAVAARAALGKIHDLRDAFKDMGMDAAGSLETLATQFKPVLRSAEMAQDRIRELVEFAKSTPYRQEGVMQANKTLEILSGGALATKEGMTMIGDAAATAGVDLEMVALWAGRLYDALQSGTPIGYATMRLQELGLMSGNVRRQLESMQETGASFSDMWSVAAGEFGKAQGAMTDLSKTLEGLQSTYEDTKDILQSSFSQGFLEGEKAGIRTSTAAMEALIPVAKELGESMGFIPNMMARATEKMLGFITSSAAFGPVVKTVITGGILALKAAVLTGAINFVRFGVALYKTATAGKAAAAAHLATAAAAGVDAKLAQLAAVAKQGLAAGNMAIVRAATAEAASLVASTAALGVNTSAHASAIAVRGGLMNALKALITLQMAEARAHLASAAASWKSLAAHGKLAAGISVMRVSFTGLLGVLAKLPLMIGKMAWGLISDPLFGVAAAALLVVSALINLGFKWAAATKAARAYNDVTDQMARKHQTVISNLKTENDLLKARTDAISNAVAAQRDLQKALDEQARVESKGGIIDKFINEMIDPSAGKVARARRRADQTEAAQGELFDPKLHEKLDYTDAEKEYLASRQKSKIAEEQIRIDGERERKRAGMSERDVLADKIQELAEYEGAIVDAQNQMAKGREHDNARGDMNARADKLAASYAAAQERAAGLRKELVMVENAIKLANSDPLVPLDPKDIEAAERLRKELEGLEETIKHTGGKMNEARNAAYTHDFNQANAGTPLGELKAMEGRVRLRNEFESNITGVNSLEEQIAEKKKSFEGMNKFKFSLPENLMSQNALDLANASPEGWTDEYAQAKAELAEMERRRDDMLKRQDQLRNFSKNWRAVDETGQTMNEAWDVNNEKQKTREGLALEAAKSKVLSKSNVAQDRKTQLEVEIKQMRDRQNESDLERRLQYEKAVIGLRNDSLEKQRDLLAKEREIIMRTEKDADRKKQALELNAQERKRLDEEASKEQSRLSESLMANFYDSRRSMREATGDSRGAEQDRNLSNMIRDNLAKQQITDELAPKIGREAAADQAGKTVRLNQLQREFDENQSRMGQGYVVAGEMAKLGLGGRVTGRDPAIDKMEKQINILKEMESLLQQIRDKNQGGIKS